ncbi:MAG: endonuclease NucS [Thermofilaceae archaeon]|nr:endonuclease NucS [Thermofilaceae archaeon]MCX8179761.1 endonuclease NucS [Thermofilaceae archaeon]MDW8004288.1 endonuclease NucS [Thermofilaceae archaeon]
MDVYYAPSLEKAKDEVRRAVEYSHTCLLVAQCSVKYRGRASSTLGPGQRLIVIKQDGCVLVHRPVGNEPVNWQPPGSKVSTELRDGKLVLKTVRLRPLEELLIEIEKVELLAHGKLKDEGELYMYGSETELRDIVVENPWVIGEGLKPVEVERRTRAGFVDALFVDPDGRLVVVEVKKGTAGVEAVAQLKKYVEALKHELGREVVGMLVAERLSRGARTVLEKEGLKFKSLDLGLVSRLAGGRGKLI